MYSIEHDKEDKPSEYYTRFVPDMSDIISGLNNLKFNVEKPLEQLQRGWKSQIFDLAFQTAKFATRTIEGEMFLEHSSMTWGEYQQLFFEDGCCANFAARPTGVIRELFWEVVSLDYGFAEQAATENFPENADMYFNSIETLDDNGIFRNFIQRMFGGDPNLKFRSIFDVFKPTATLEDDNTDELPW